MRPSRRSVPIHLEALESRTLLAAHPTVTDLPEPAVTSSAVTYRNFSNRPLFASSGPSANDVRQGDLGDCYYLATLASIAKTDPNLIRKTIVKLNDGTYAVQFARGDNKVVVRVDADLPTWSSGQLAYADLGAQGSLWVALMEKAYAFFRTNSASYASLAGGWMQEAYAALGKASANLFPSTSLLQLVQQQLNQGLSVTYAAGNVPPATPLISYHAYSVDAVVTDRAGNPVALRLRNPWGVDGAGNDGRNDGYVTISEPQATAALMGLVVASV